MHPRPNIGRIFTATLTRVSLKLSFLYARRYVMPQRSANLELATNRTTHKSSGEKKKKQKQKAKRKNYRP
jgi:hypothetical protein